jgi:ParB/RepB/Spo0J family partition protein
VNVRKSTHTAEFKKSNRDLKLQLLSEKTLTTPLEVLPRNKDGKHEIIAGSRRFAAMSELYREGHAWARTLPCIIRNLTWEDARRHSMIENLQRNNLGPYEEGSFYEDQLLRFPDRYRSIRDLAKALGISERHVLMMRPLSVLHPQVGNRVRVYISNAKEREEQKLLPLSHGLSLAKLFSEPKMRERFSNRSSLKEQVKLANAIYGLDLPDVKRYLAIYRSNSTIGKTRTIRKVRRVRLRKRRKQRRGPPGRNVLIHFEAAEFAILQDLASSFRMTIQEFIKAAANRAVKDGANVPL